MQRTLLSLPGWDIGQISRVFTDKSSRSSFFTDCRWGKGSSNTVDLLLTKHHRENKELIYWTNTEILMSTNYTPIVETDTQESSNYREGRMTNWVSNLIPIGVLRSLKDDPGNRGRTVTPPPVFNPDRRFTHFSSNGQGHLLLNLS